MSKRNTIKFNPATINNDFIKTISAFHKAENELARLTKEGRQEIKAINESIAKILSDRQNDLDAGIPVDEVTRKYSTVELNKKLKLVKEKYKKLKKPCNKAIEACGRKLPDNLYEGYKATTTKGVMADYSRAVQEFLVEIGAVNTTSEKAVCKFATLMSTRTCGVKKATGKDWESGRYTAVKSEKVFKEVFLLAFLDYAVNEKGFLTKNEDNSITITVYKD